MNRLKWIVPVVCSVVGWLAQPAFAEEVANDLQGKHFEIGLEFLKMETVGYRLNASYVLNARVPSVFSRIGFDIGQRLFDADAGEKKTIKALDYGYFMESLFYSKPEFLLYSKTAVHTLVFPKEYSSKSSMSSIDMELGATSVYGAINWRFGAGFRYRDKDSGKIVVGNDVIDKQVLFYPKIGFGFIF
jgi:hypothetical protein